jgi:hypothetical protein
MLCCQEMWMALEVPLASEPLPCEAVSGWKGEPKTTFFAIYSLRLFSRSFPAKIKIGSTATPMTARTPRSETKLLFRKATVLQMWATFKYRNSALIFRARRNRRTSIDRLRTSRPDSRKSRHKTGALQNALVSYVVMNTFAPRSGTWQALQETGGQHDVIRTLQQRIEHVKVRLPSLLL